MANILDGKALSEHWLVRCEAFIRSQVAAGKRAPGLGIILVGNDSASEVYVKRKQKACLSVGIRCYVQRLPVTTSRQAVLEAIDAFNQATEIDGLFLQLPLPGSIVEVPECLERILPTKDVDGLHPMNLGKLFQGRPGLRPCTSQGIRLLLQHYAPPLAGLEALVIGRSLLVGCPMAAELLHLDCTVTVAHSKTIDLERCVRRSDLVIVAVGIPEFLPGHWVKPGAILVDVGIHRKLDQRLVGDLQFAEAQTRAAWISPVPNGVGPMTVASLLRNTCEAYALGPEGDAVTLERFHAFF